MYLAFVAVFVFAGAAFMTLAAVVIVAATFSAARGLLVGGLLDIDLLLADATALLAVARLSGTGLTGGTLSVLGKAFVAALLLCFLLGTSLLVYG